MQDCLLKAYHRVRGKIGKLSEGQNFRLQNALEDGYLISHKRGDVKTIAAWEKVCYEADHPFVAIIPAETKKNMWIALHKGHPDVHEVLNRASEFWDEKRLVD